MTEPTGGLATRVVPMSTLAVLLLVGAAPMPLLAQDGTITVRVDPPTQVVPDLHIEKRNADGYARPGGVVLYPIDYRNDGDGTAENVQILDTLPPQTGYAGDTSGVAPIEGTSVIRWKLGTMESDQGFRQSVATRPVGLAARHTLRRAGRCDHARGVNPRHAYGAAAQTRADAHHGQLKTRCQSVGAVDVHHDEAE